MHNFLDSNSDKVLSASWRRIIQTKFRDNISTSSNIVKELIHKDQEIIEDNTCGRHFDLVCFLHSYKIYLWVKTLQEMKDYF